MHKANSLVALIKRYKAAVF